VKNTLTMRATPEVVTEKGDMETAARTQVSVQAVAVDSGESNEDGVAQILSSQNPPENTEGEIALFVCLALYLMRRRTGR